MTPQVDLREFPAVLNLRDLGGLPTNQGLTLASGRLYRSGDPSPFGLLSGTTVAFRTVVDLRMSAELKPHEERLRSPACNYLHCALFEAARPEWIAPADQSPRATAERYLEMLSGGTNAFVEIVRALGERDAQPVLIHCVAGRDRTGIVIACVLDLLGVPDEAIAVDYALSDRFINDGGRAHSQTMLDFLTLLRQQWGSTHEMLVAHGASAEHLARLCSCFLGE